MSGYLIGLVNGKLEMYVCVCGGGGGGRASSIPRSEEQTMAAWTDVAVTTNGEGLAHSLQYSRAD